MVATAWRAGQAVGDIFATEPRNRDASDDFWYGPAGARSATDIVVTPLGAMQAAAVYSSVRVIAETIAALPLGMHIARPDGGSDRALNHPIHDLLATRPNADQTAMEWRETMLAHLLLRGMSYNEIKAGPRGPVDQLVPIHPDRVVPRRLKSGRIAYRVSREDGGQSILMDDEVFVVRGLLWDGVQALDPISAVMREAIGVALGAQKFSGRWLANDARPSGVIEMESKFRSTKEQQEFRDAFQEAQTGWKFGKTAVLQQGMTWKDVSMTNRQSQFLEQRRYSDVEIARLFRVPPHMIGILDRATFSNIEQQSIDFVTHTILPWAIRIEQAITTQLIIAPQRFFPKHNVSGLLRGDTQTRFGAYAQGRQWGWLSANDVRALEDMNPIGPAGDIYLSPSNMMPADRADGPPSGVAMLAGDAAGRVLRKEIQAIGKAAATHHDSPESFANWAEDFYRDHAAFMGGVLRIGENMAMNFAMSRCAEICAVAREDGVPATEDLARAWAQDGAGALTQLCLEGLSDAD